MRRRTVLATVSAGLLTQLDHALALPGQPSTAAQALGTTAQYRQARRLFDAGQLAQLVDMLSTCWQLRTPTASLDPPLPPGDRLLPPRQRDTQ